MEIVVIFGLAMLGSFVYVLIVHPNTLNFRIPSLFDISLRKKDPLVVLKESAARTNLSGSTINSFGGQSALESSAPDSNLENLKVNDFSKTKGDYNGGIIGGYIDVRPGANVNIDSAYIESDVRLDGPARITNSLIKSHKK